MNPTSSSAGSVNWLPEELILQVFLRLPRKSLLRSKCVSKGLRDSVNSPIFKKSYDLFHYSFTDFAVIIPEGRLMFSMDFHLLPDNLYSCVEKEVGVPRNQPTRFTGYCKGIVCLMDLRRWSFILFNPFNGTFKFVEGSHLCGHRFSCPTGFGYDYDADDYKIVILDSLVQGNIQYLYVYSLRSDSWEQFVLEFRPDFCSHSNGICIESAIHWLWYDKSLYTCIAAFDLETKAWRSLPLPPLIDTHTLEVWLTLHDFGGRLCVSVKHLDDSDSSTILWVMEDYGVETSWTPLFTIVDSIKVLGYFPMRDSMRLLCFGLDSGLWSWLNTQDGSNENIQIHKLPRQLQAFDGHRYEAKSWVCVRSPFRLPCS